MKKARQMIRLEKDFILKLYCYCRQGERSVHRGLGSDWTGFLQYYAEGRGGAIRSLIAELHRRTGPPTCCDSPVRRELAGINLPHWGVLALWFGPWRARWKRSWSFAEREIHFIAGSLQTLLDLLEIPTKPRADVLISLRMDLGMSGGIIDARCFGLAELKRARMIEHYDRTLRVPHVQLADIVPVPTPGA